MERVFYVVLQVLIQTKCFLNQSGYMFLNGVSMSLNALKVRMWISLFVFIYLLSLSQRMDVCFGVVQLKMFSVTV